MGTWNNCPNITKWVKDLVPKQPWKSSINSLQLLLGFLGYKFQQHSTLFLERKSCLKINLSNFKKLLPLHTYQELCIKCIICTVLHILSHWYSKPFCVGFNQLHSGTVRGFFRLVPVPFSLKFSGNIYSGYEFAFPGSTILPTLLFCSLRSYRNLLTLYQAQHCFPPGDEFLWQRK